MKGEGMIQDLGRFGWRVGMILIFAVPALYFLAGIVGLQRGTAVRDAGHPVVQTLKGAS
jgi:hypothetical protein